MADPSEAPCHGEPMPVSPPAEERGVDCESPCCVAAPEPIPLTVSISVPVLAELPDVIAEVFRPEEARLAVHAEEGPPPPPRLYLETGRIRV